VVVGALSAGQAQAVVVSVNGQNWNVTTFTGTFNANTSKFATPANGGVMPWWTGVNGQFSSANSFANAVALSLGLPNFGDIGGPLFPFSSQPPKPLLAYVQEDGLGGASTFFGCTNCNPVGRDEIATWAQAELVPAPAPGPLPVFGAAAAFGFSRKLRQRIKAGSNSVSSSYSL